jgi:hypothetical protein
VVSVKILGDPIPQRPGFPHVDYSSRAVLHDIHARGAGK